jgi:hypothetical protein
MCKEMPVIPVDRAVDKKRIIGKKLRAKEEERHKRSLIPKKGIYPITQAGFDPTTFELSNVDDQRTQPRGLNFFI